LRTPTLGLGKIALSLLDERALERYISHGLQAFTPASIVSADRLKAELAEIRAGGVAFDREEFAEDHCCLAVPVLGASGRAVAALGISMSARCFELEREPLSAVLREVAERASDVLTESAVPAISEEPAVLEQPVRSTLGSRLSPATTPST
jgi:IclR family acetate operon transcriptional repressor